MSGRGDFGCGGLELALAREGGVSGTWSWTAIGTSTWPWTSTGQRHGHGLRRTDVRGRRRKSAGACVRRQSSSEGYTTDSTNEPGEWPLLIKCQLLMVSVSQEPRF